MDQLQSNLYINTSKKFLNHRFLLEEELEPVFVLNEVILLVAAVVVT
jgi:hypothetical protein